MRAFVAEEESSKTRTTRRPLRRRKSFASSSSFSSIIFYVIVVTVVVSLVAFVDGREFENRRAFGGGSSLKTTRNKLPKNLNKLRLLQLSPPVPFAKARSSKPSARTFAISIKKCPKEAVTLELPESFWTRKFRKRNLKSLSLKRKPD